VQGINLYGNKAFSRVGGFIESEKELNKIPSDFRRGQKPTTRESLSDGCLASHHKRISNLIVQSLFAGVEDDHDVTDAENKSGNDFRKIAENGFRSVIRLLSNPTTLMPMTIFPSVPWYFDDFHQGVVNEKNYFSIPL